jgi:hypothetical protein
MRSLMRMHLAYAAIALISAVGIPTYYWVVVPEPKQLHGNALNESVAQISDPERLRKLATTVAREADDFAVTAKRAVDSAIVLLAMALVAAAIAFLHAYFRLRHLQRQPEEAKPDAL